MGSPRILAFSASTRAGSLNRRFLAHAVPVVREAGCEVTVADLLDFEMPLYNGDLEDRSGLPDGARRLIAEISAHDGLLIASPEYNSMVTPLLKNTIDWCTRGDGNPFEGKAAAVISASPGPFGGVRSLVMAQNLLLKLGCQVVPGQCALIHADKAFDAGGKLTDLRAQKAVRALAAHLAKAARA
jgi:chromate reductase